MISTNGQESERLRVLMLAGYSRSGSTLVARILEGVPGFVSPGEIRHLWARGFRDDHRCACGEPFSACPFWSGVRRRTFGTDTPAPRVVAAVLRTQRHVDHLYRIPQLLRARNGHGRDDRFDRALAHYRSALLGVYRAIREESGASVIVDASKDVSHAFVVATMPEVDLSVVHLVRDSRAVASSWLRRMHDPATGRDLRRQPAVRSALEWNLTNLAGEALGRVTPEVVRLRYEDLAADPATFARRVAGAAGAPDVALPFDGDGVLELGDSHALSGNPLLFRRGPTPIRPDLGWRDELPTGARVVTTALTYPVLRRYGYRPALEVTR
jgi:hypothetical protein